MASDQKNKLELLGSAPIPKALLALGLPTMMGMLINALYNLADAYFVGGLGTDAMGAVTVAFPLGQVIVGLGLLFGNGAAAYLPRLLGRGDGDIADKVASTALYSSVLTGTIAIIFAFVFLEPLLRMIGAVDGVMPYAVSYTSVYLAFAVFNVFNVAMNNIVSSEGAAKTAMFALATGAALNVILDPLFIYSLDLGVAGAAIATGASQMVSTLLYVIYILRKHSIFSFGIRKFCFTRDIMAEILKVGIPTLVFQLLTSFSISMINSSAAVFGGSALAAMGPVTRIISIGSLIIFGFLKGFQAIAGYSYGASDYGRLRESIRVSAIWSTIFCVTFGLIIALFSNAIICQFTKDDLEMIRIGRMALTLNGLSFMFFGFYTVYSFLFLVMGKAGKGLFLGACRQGICFLPTILVFPSVFGLDGVLLSQPLADVLSFVITVFVAISFHRELSVSEHVCKNDALLQGRVDDRGDCNG